LNIFYCYIVEGTSPRSNDNEKKEKDLKVKIKEASSSWVRILKLGQPEWKFYIVGFFVLLISSLSKIII
jgi:hypothetical protein